MTPEELQEHMREQLKLTEKKIHENRQKLGDDQLDDELKEMIKSRQEMRD